MPGLHYDEISYPEIITFLNVAQTLNMSISAQAMHISQPAVSKRIANMERKFNLTLFFRKDGGLQITEAGKVLYQELLHSVEHLQTGLAKAQEIQSKPSRILKLWHDGFFDLPILNQIIQSYSSQHPSVRVDAGCHFDEDMEDCSLLFSEKADFVICPDSFAYNYEPYINKMPIASFQFSILISRDHPLAQKSNVTPGDLVGVPLIVAHNYHSSPYIKAIHSIMACYGVSPQIGYLSTREDLCFDIVSRSGIAIASSAFWQRMNSRAAAFFSEKISVFPIQNAYYPVSLIWRKSAIDPVMDDFAKTFGDFISKPENAEIILQSYGK